MKKTAPFRLGPLHSLVTPVARKLPDGLIRDTIYPNMYQLRLADGSLNDMVNLTRAMDAALETCSMTDICTLRALGKFASVKTVRSHAADTSVARASNS